MTPQEKLEVTPGSRDSHQSRGDRHSHSWMMMAFCVPMIVIAVILFTSGVSVGFILIALMCAVMMALIMGAMNHDARR